MVLVVRQLFWQSFFHFSLFCFVLGFFWSWKAQPPQGALAVKMPRNGFHISHASWQIIFASYAFHSCLGDGKIFFPWPFKVWLLLPLWKLNWKPGSWWQFLETLANLHTETLHQWETPTGPHYNSNTDIWKILKNFFFLIIVGNWGSWGFLNNFFCSQPRTETAATKLQRISQKYLNGKRWLLQTPFRSPPKSANYPCSPLGVPVDNYTFDYNKVP